VEAGGLANHVAVAAEPLDRGVARGDGHRVGAALAVFRFHVELEAPVAVGVVGEVGDAGRIHVAVDVGKGKRGEEQRRDCYERPTSISTHPKLQLVNLSCPPTAGQICPWTPSGRTSW